MLALSVRLSFSLSVSLSGLTGEALLVAAGSHPRWNKVIIVDHLSCSSLSSTLTWSV